jgi:hypothetical protein
MPALPDEWTARNRAKLAGLRRDLATLEVNAENRSSNDAWRSADERTMANLKREIASFEILLGGA